MDQQLLNHESKLRVYLHDKPEFPNIGRDSSSPCQDPAVDFQEHIFGDSLVKCHAVVGKNVLLQQFMCYTEEDQKIFTIPAQPVVSFHIQVYGDFKMKFVEEQDSRPYIEGQCSLFWQSDHILCCELPKYESDFFTLHFRPSHFLEMSHRFPLLTEFAAEVALSPFGILDFYIGNADESRLSFIDAILHEVRDYHTSDQRYTHLCECLLLQSMGLDVEAEPFPSDTLRRTHDSAFSVLDDHELTDEQKLSVEISRRYVKRDQLIAEFYEHKKEFEERKEERAEFNAIMKKIAKSYHSVMGKSADNLAESYFWMAEKLAEEMKRFDLTDREKATVVEAIIALCDQSFELSAPHMGQLDFYTSYTGQPYDGDLAMREFGQMLDMFIPDINLPLDKLDGTRKGSAILEQYMQDEFGFKPLSHFKETGEIDKTPKVVELYHLLMQHMVDELTITDSGDLKKSDLIRVIDHAYQRNDLSLLLLVEIEQLTGDTDYVEKQKYNKICLWVLALEEAIDEWDSVEYTKEEDQLLYLIQVYYVSSDKIKAVKRRVMKTKRIYDAMVPALLNAGYALGSVSKKSIFMLTAESLIAMAEKLSAKE
ncbi:hypothetical protein [Sphingobacterium faecale]|uniref:Uncharacterized protein n=1 Tax=Sphingobacterium faecale TaxID=2803775 RepID=A0ABS1RA68_9SPHI|nr:hypothetical protein [Sphingobacterium faecale]MBL1411435.1 hypothetical protein [Sphingobacterium faecale]